MYLNFLLGAVIYAVVYILHALEDVGGPSLLIFSSVVTVILIITGSSLRRFLDKRAETLNTPGRRASLQHVLYSRESVLPLSLLAALYMNERISSETFLTVWNEKADLVILILIFSIIAEGIRESGYFRYMALRVISLASGPSRKIDEERLALSLFFLCSILSYFFTNDIVVLVITPIALEVCRRSKIKDARIVLVVVFIAANAMAMGLLIGPPKNIIVAREMKLDFFEYAAVMLVPSLLMVLVGLLFTSFLIRRYSGFGSYQVEVQMKYAKFTKNMRSWLTVHILTVAFVAANSFWGISFMYAGIIVIPASIFLIWKEYRRKNQGQALERRRVIYHIYERLFAHAPVQIFIFAFVFFAVSEQFGRLLFESHTSYLEVIEAYLQEGSFFVSFVIIAVTGLATNVLNDLPASALISEVLVAAGVSGLNDIFGSILVIQSFLVGLGVGAYLGPTATLAAIIWFHQMNRHESEDMINPTWLDMLRYGIVYFLLTVCAISLLLPILLPISIFLVAVSSQEGRGLSQYVFLEGTLLDGRVIFSLVVAVAIAFLGQKFLRKRLPNVGAMVKALIGR